MNELAADVFAGPVKLMALEGCDDKHLDTLAPHPQCHKLHGKGFSRAAGSQDRHVRILVDLGIEDIHDDKGIVDFVCPKQDTIVIAQLESRKQVTACGAGRQHVALGAPKQMLFQTGERQRRQKSLLFPKRAGAYC